jgi:hypothetical protein
MNVVVILPDRQKEAKNQKDNSNHINLSPKILPLASYRSEKK